MQKDLAKLADKNVTVVAVSYDSVEVLAKFAEKQKITFPLLSDPDSAAIKAYGLLNKEAKGKQQGVPYPGTLVIDKKGVVRAKLFHTGVVARHSADDILKAVESVKD